MKTGSRLSFCFLFLVLEITLASSFATNHHVDIARHSRLARGLSPPKPKHCRVVQNNSTPKPPMASSAVINSTFLCHGKPSGATTAIIPSGGPNGAESWINCGINGAGWTPPFVKVTDLVAVELATALKSPNSPFHHCAPYLSLFEKYAGLHNIPAILLASFAMQESGCNPATVGGGGEQGLMQITQEKCVGAPNGNCKDPNFNIKTAAAYFAGNLASNNGSIFLTVGEYNGWSLGLTYAKATAARHSDCCRCQNNLDYLEQFFNGWLQNINPYGKKLGVYFNLDVCPKE